MLNRLEIVPFRASRPVGVLSSQVFAAPQRFQSHILGLTRTDIADVSSCLPHFDNAPRYQLTYKKHGVEMLRTSSYQQEREVRRCMNRV